jgi:hypothetical protein
MIEMKSQTRALIRRAVPNRLIHSVFRRRLENCVSNIKFSRFLDSRKIDKSRLLILATTPRSGTNYMQFLFANYLKLLSGTSDGPVDANTKNSMLPNTWAASYISQKSFQTPTSNLKLIGLDDLVATHTRYQDPHWNNSKVLHIYRNPLDFVVSTYFFVYEYRTSRVGNMANPVDVMDNHLGAYADVYRSFREAARSGNRNLLRVAYEDLITYPAATFRIILRWLGLEADISLVELATQLSSTESIRKLEDRDGPIDPVIDTPGGRFVRDGSIGQWKKYFRPEDVDLARSKLASFGVSLDEFTLEV